MKITLSSSAIIKFLLIITLLLIVIHIAILGVYFIIDDPKRFDFVRMFDLDMERNIPTLFSSLLFTISSFLFYLLSHIEIKEKSKYWFGLSLIFIFLAFDESVKLHEKLGDYVENFIDASGYLYYPWFIPYTIAVSIIAIFYIRFFLAMEKKIFYSFILSAIIFLTGAIGFDILGANEASIHSEETLLYCIYYTIEESLEMFGLVYLISILLGLLEGSLVEVA